MAYVALSTSSVAAGTYGITNDCAGQAAAQIVAACSAASIVSDNNPANTIARSILIKVGTNVHYIKLSAGSGSAITLTLLNSAQTSSMTLVSYLITATTLLANTSTFHILSGPNTMMILYGDQTGTAAQTA